MKDKHPTQAAGSKAMPGEPGEVGPDPERDQAGESGGGHYPNPHDDGDEKETDRDSSLGHGGQSEIAYHGTGQLGEEKLGPNPNSPAEED